MIQNKKVSKGIFKVLTGVIVGGAIGSILGLTLAPKKGEETRKAIREKSVDMFMKGKTELENLNPKEEMGTIKRVIVKILTPKKSKVK